MKHSLLMQLLPQCDDEYKKRHDAIWPDLAKLLKSYGISDYSISLEPSTLQLFAVFTTPDNFNGDKLKLEPLMQQWWKHMSPLMETKPESHEPKVTTLLPVFYLE